MLDNVACPRAHAGSGCAQKYESHHFRSCEREHDRFNDVFLNHNDDGDKESAHSAQRLKNAITYRLSTRNDAAFHIKLTVKMKNRAEDIYRWLNMRELSVACTTVSKTAERNVSWTRYYEQPCRIDQSSYFCANIEGGNYLCEVEKQTCADCKSCAQ